MTVVTNIRIGRWRLASPTTAWLLAALIVALLATFAALAAAAHDLTLSDFWNNLVIVVAIAVIGLLVAVRQPRNPIGWICLAMVVLSALGYATKGVIVQNGRLAAPCSGTGCESQQESCGVVWRTATQLQNDDDCGRGLAPAPEPVTVQARD